MRIPALVEPIPEGGFRATRGGPFSISVDAQTADEAIDLLTTRVQGRLTSGARLTDLDVEAEDNPLAPFEGMFRDNPLFDEWKQAIADYRREIDEDPDAT